MSADRRWQLRIEHMLDAIEKIQRYASGTTEDQFVAGSMVVDAVIRNFQVLGEAVRHVPSDIQSKYTDVPWRLIEGMRHILVHDYFAVKTDVVWRTIQQSLPPIVEPLRRILQDNP
jgi:uncharacterized protein with HEPN domain